MSGIGKVPTAMRWFVSGVLLAGMLQSAVAQKFSTASESAVNQFFGTTQLKVVFFAEGLGLYLVDYTRMVGGSPTVTLLPNTSGASFPVISPDGNYVTYATNVFEEYTREPGGKVWLRSLMNGKVFQVGETGYVPRFVQDKEQVKVLYATAAANLTPRKYGFEGAGKMVVATFDGTSSFAYDTIWPHGVMLGGMSRDGRYMAHGESEPHSFLLDMQGSSTLPAALHCLDGGVAPQVCNTSISSSSYYPNTLLYFDFGGTAAALGGSWGLHKKLFISRSDAAVMRHYNIPGDIRIYGAEEHPGKGEIFLAEWSNPEWSNHPYFATAALLATRLWNIHDGNPDNGNWYLIEYIKNERIYAINLKDSAYLPVVMSTDTICSATFDTTFDVTTGKMKIDTNLVLSTTSFYNPWMWVGSGAPVEVNGWLENPRYVPATACRLPEPPTPTPTPKSDDGPCGKGAVGAMLPPLLFLKLWKRKKKNVANK